MASFSIHFSSIIPLLEKLSVWTLKEPAGRVKIAASVREEMMAKGILIAAMDFSSTPEDEFHDWYDLEHIPERLRVPGFLNGDRWTGTENPKISVATYDLDNVGVLHSSPSLSVAGEHRTPCTQRPCC